MIRNVVVMFSIICMADLSFSQNKIEVSAYRVRTPLPQLADEISMEYPYESQYVERQVQPISQFEPLPQQNTWVVLGVIIAAVSFLILASFVLAGS